MYEVQLTPEIKAIYTPWKGDPETGCSDSMEIVFFKHGREVWQSNLKEALRLKYEPKLWKDLRERKNEVILDRMLDDINFINEKVLDHTNGYGG